MARKRYSTPFVAGVLVAMVGETPSVRNNLAKKRYIVPLLWSKRGTVPPIVARVVVAMVEYTPSV